MLFREIIPVYSVNYTERIQKLCGHNAEFLGTFEKLRKTTISFVMSVHPLVSMKQLGSHWSDFHEISYLRIFQKSVQKIRVSLKSDKTNGYLRWRPVYIYDNISLNSASPPPGATQPIVGVYFTALYRTLASSRTRLLDHTQRRATVGRAPLNEWSVRRGDLYLTTHNTHNRQTTMPRVGFEPTIVAGERP